METYNSSLDTFSKIISSFVFFILIGGIYLSLTIHPWYGGFCLSFISALLIICFYPYRVVGYKLTADKLIIERPFVRLNKEILYSEMESAELRPKEDFKGTIRTGGNGGLFGYSGFFMNNKLGTFRAYSTNRNNRILITLKAKHEKIVISPDDIGMADALQKRLK
jgi:hypothetical protein